jgi:hypothetical protein
VSNRKKYGLNAKQRFDLAKHVEARDLDRPLPGPVQDFLADRNRRAGDAPAAP